MEASERGERMLPRDSVTQPAAPAGRVARFDEDDTFEQRDREPADDEDEDDVPLRGPANGKNRSGKSRRAGNTPGTKRAQPRAVYPEPDDNPDDEDDRLEKKGWFSRGSKPARKKKPARKGKTPKSAAVQDAPGRFAGGRWLTIALKTVVWAAVLLMMFAGFKQVFMPSRLNVDQVSQTVMDKLQLSDYPVETGSALAVAFARDYLQFAKDDAGARGKRLRTYLPENATGADAPDAGWTVSTSTVPQVVLNGPYVVSAPVIDGDRATYVIAAQVGDPETVDAAGAVLAAQWVSLSVPVVRDTDGRVAVGGAPGFISSPVRAAAGVPDGLVADPGATQSLAGELPGMMQAWAASDEAGLKRFLPATATDAAKTGLHDLVTFSSINDVQVAKTAGANDPRAADVTVTWDYRGTAMQQQYRLWVWQGTDGLWYMEDIQGAGFTLP